MKVLHIQTGLPKSGNVPYKLHKAFLKNKISSKLIVFESKIIDESVIEVKRFRRRIQAVLYYKYQNFLNNKLIKGSYHFSHPMTIGTNLSKSKVLLDTDVIYLHWAIGGFLSYKSLEKIFKVGKPVIINLHDMWYITGGCHHSFTCNKFTTGCDSCPMFIKRGNHLAAYQINKKKNLYEKYNNVYFLAPSQWIFEAACNSFALSKSKVFRIPHFIDEQIFNKKDQNICRDKFQIPNDITVIGFGALNATSNTYKGFEYLMSALVKLEDYFDVNTTLLVVFGSEKGELLNASPFNIMTLGKISDDNILSDLYNCFNVFVTPSLAESFGMTALESVSCGTPVACFDIGGLKDIVIHMKNGYRARYKDVDDLSYGIRYCVDAFKSKEIKHLFIEKEIIDMHVELLKMVTN